MRTFPKLSEYTEKEWEVRIFMWFEALLSLWDSAWFFLSHIAGRSSFPTPLKADEEKHLIEAMLSGDNSASARLIEHNLRLVAHIAKKYTHSSIDADDFGRCPGSHPYGIHDGDAAVTDQIAHHLA